MLRFNRTHLGRNFVGHNQFVDRRLAEPHQRTTGRHSRATAHRFAVLAGDDSGAFHPIHPRSNASQGTFTSGSNPEWLGVIVVNGCLSGTGSMGFEVNSMFHVSPRLCEVDFEVPTLMPKRDAPMPQVAENVEVEHGAVDRVNCPWLPSHRTLNVASTSSSSSNCFFIHRFKEASNTHPAAFLRRMASMAVLTMMRRIQPSKEL